MTLEKQMQLQGTAYHEAGHAVASYVLQGQGEAVERFEYVTV